MEKDEIITQREMPPEIPETEKTYSYFELQNILERERDRIVAQSREKWLKTLDEEKLKAVEEATKNITEENLERLRELNEKIAKMEEEKRYRDAELFCMSELNRRSLPESLCRAVISYDSEEEMIYRLDMMELLIKTRADEEIERRMARFVPDSGKACAAAANFAGMSLEEIQRLKDSGAF